MEARDKNNVKVSATLTQFRDQDRMDIAHKLAHMLPHWIEHNEEHARSYEDWGKRAGEAGMETVAREVETAVKAVMAANEALKKALAAVEEH